jgi:AraC-like DNA-binding protein
MYSFILKDNPYAVSIQRARRTGSLRLVLEEGLYLHYAEGQPSPAIEMLFTEEWLQMHLAGMEEKIKKLGESLAPEAYTSILTSKILPADELMIGKLEQELLHPDEHLLTIRARLLLLLSNAISRWPGQETNRTPLKKNWHVQTIHQVEQRLVQSLEDMLPPQKQLAKEFALSESTLKRHFKAVYGRTMYDYYLEKKMNLAKSLLQEKKISVSETAYKLGYEKVSAFISMFKKYHNILPGSLK